MATATARQQRHPFRLAGLLVGGLAVLYGFLWYALPFVRRRV